MHIEKNVCENVIGTLLNIKGKSKDDPKARYDLECMGIRHKLHPIQLPNGRLFFPPASYSMTRTEKEVFLNVLKNVKVPDGYASQISRGINVKDRKLQALKTHDYHILMQDLLPIALRSSMNKQVTMLIIELSSIFKAICSKVLNVDELNMLKSRAALVLCHMERCFPPSFFTIMIHLVIHLADEAKLAGPVQYRWMYPIERCLKVFKKYVGNRAHPEGSIAEGYVAEECHTFCSRYFDGIETIFNRPRRNNDIDPVEREKYLFSSGGLFKGASEVKILDDISLAQAHRYVLLHLDEVQSYVEEFKRYKIQNFRNKRHVNNPTTLQRLVAEEFHAWFKTHVSNMNIENVPDIIRWLSMGPSAIVKTFKGFVFNGIHFRTKEGNRGKRSQNYGVVVTSTTPSVASSRDPNLIDGEIEYFGELTQILELNYSGKLKVVLFRCDWADTTRDRGVKKDEYGFTLVNFRVEFNDRGQPIETGRVKLASGCGAVARMGNYCSLIHKNWSKVSKPMKREIIKYMKERYVFLAEKETYERYVLMSIGKKWRQHKHRLGKVVYELARTKPIEEITAQVPEGVDASQWIHLVNYSLSEEGIKASNNAKAYRNQMKYVHRGGNKSHAQIRLDMEKKKRGPVSDIELFRAVHMKEDGEVDDEIREILERCDALLAEKKAAHGDSEDNEQTLDDIELENMVLREIRGPEHPGRVRGQGMGPTPSSFFGYKRHGTFEVSHLQAELAAERRERDILLAAERAERDALLATERAERDALLAVERTERAKLEAQLQEMQKMLQLYVRR